MLACASAPSLKTEKTNIENKSLNLKWSKDWLLLNFIYIHTYMYLGLQKSTMAAQITPSYIFAGIYQKKPY